MTATNKRSDCPISCALDIWGDKWSLLIVRDLLNSKQCTYGDFLKSNEKIATNILASRLRSLEKFGIITKSSHPESKAKYLYMLTQRGIDLIPIMIEISLWSEKYVQIPADISKKLDEIKKDKVAFIEKAKQEFYKTIKKA